MRPTRGTRSWLPRFAALALAASAAAPSGALAQGALAGTWTAGPLTVRFDVQSWGPHCGPRPEARSTEPGGTVRVTHEGETLTFGGAVQGRSDSCWSPTPGLRRTSATASNGRWRVECRTSSSDAHPEKGRYELRADGPNRLLYSEVTEYDWALSGSICVATRNATRTFTREAPVAARMAEPEPTTEPQAVAATSAAIAATEPEPEPERCTAGAPADVRLRPRHAEVEPGERVCFRARVVDAAGCEVRGAEVRFELSSPEGRAGALDEHCFEAGTDPATAEGAFEIAVVAAPDLRGTATVTVQSADLSHLRAGRSASGGAPAPGVDVAAEASGASGVSARGVAATERGGLGWLLLGGAGFLVLVLGVGLVVFALRKRGAAAAPPAPLAPSAPPPALAPAPPAVVAPPPTAVAPPAAAPPPQDTFLTCPACGTKVSADSTFCPRDGTPLHARAAAAPAENKICPTCRRGYPPETRVCPNDTTALVPYSQFRAAAEGTAAGASGQTKVCPKCGARYPASRGFCGRDGAELVVVN